MTETSDERDLRLARVSHRVRELVLETCARAGRGHLTSSLSCVEILVTLYHGGVLRHDPRNPSWEGRDRFILSKGQASPALYSVLAEAGYFESALLGGFAQAGGRMGVHLQGDVPGAEITSGSLGHGIGIAAGLALAFSMDGHDRLAVTLLGDGECHEGSVWETAMFASHRRLVNLVAIVDRNRMCATGFTEEVVALEPLEDKWRAFGWETVRVDGHSHAALRQALTGVRDRTATGRPLAILAETVKGRGIPCTENRVLWHGRAPAPEELARCREELARERPGG